MARPIERPEHHYKPFEYTINIEDAFDYLDEFKNSPDYPKTGTEMGIIYTPNKYQILGDRLEAEFGIDMIEARKIVGEWFKRNSKKIIRLTESDLTRIVKRVIKEAYQNESIGKMFKNIGKRISGDIFSHTIDDGADPFLQHVRKHYGEEVDYIVVNPPKDQFGSSRDLMVGYYSYFKCADEECSYHYSWTDKVPKQFKDYIYSDMGEYNDDEDESYNGDRGPGIEGGYSDRDYDMGGGPL